MLYGPKVPVSFSQSDLKNYLCPHIMSRYTDFPSQHLSGLSLLFVLLYLSCPIWILFLARLYLIGFKMYTGQGPDCSSTIIRYCSNTYLQMGTCRTPPSFSFCSQTGPLYFLVRNWGQCYSSILKAVRNQLPAFHFLPHRC